MIKSWVILLLVLIGFAISGCASICASIGPENGLFGGGRVTTAAANQIFDPGFEGITDEQLVQLLDPKPPPAPDDKAPVTAQDTAPDFEKLNNSAKIATLRMAFKTANRVEDATARRSQIQDRLIAASNQRCNLYTTYLKRVNTYENGIFGTLTTVLGGAGAIVTGETAARTLSGLAGISSGTRAELNQAIFESIATSIIIPGIQSTRKNFLKEIMVKRKKESIEIYTIEGAIADAITYHGYCSMDTGISFAQKSIQTTDNIQSIDDRGMTKLIEIIKQIEGANKSAQ